MLLLKSASDKTSLVALKRTIGASLDLVEPLAGDGTNRGRRSDSIPEQQSHQPSLAAIRDEQEHPDKRSAQGQ
jgi:hypothetical protein